VPNADDLVFWLSLGGLLVLIVRNFLLWRRVGEGLFHISLLVACGGAYIFLFQTGPQVQPKSDQPSQWAFLVVLYACTVIGMLSNYLYNRFAAAQESRRPFDFWNFVAPVFLSPVVFCPLYNAFVSAGVDLGTFSASKLMIFFVAFEQGFFWKDFLESRDREQRRRRKPSRESLQPRSAD
jgi:hypothetical protein